MRKVLSARRSISAHASDQLQELLCAARQRPVEAAERQWTDGRAEAQRRAYPGVRTRLPATPAHFIGCFFCTTCTKAMNRHSKAMDEVEGASNYLRNPAPKGVSGRGISHQVGARFADTRKKRKQGVQQCPRRKLPLLTVFQEGYELRA